MEKCSINGPTTLTNREQNSMFVDTLPSPYYDMLIVNTFVEFGDLMYSVGRIEDGINRGKIVDTGASMMKKERIVPDEHVQAMSRERRSKKSHIWHEMSPSRIILVCHCMPKFRRPVFLHPRSSYENVIETLIQVVIRARRGKEPKCIAHFQ